MVCGQQWIYLYQAEKVKEFNRSDVARDGFKGGPCGPGPPQISIGQVLYKTINIIQRLQAALYGEIWS